MAHNLWQQFILHPVGQGLFYSGEVYVDALYKTEAHFHFVMDCGSLNRNNIKDEVTLYRETPPGKKNIIDLLIISHFDADHVNYIGSLLKDKKVKTIVAPFLNFTERLFLLLQAIEQKLVNPNDPDDSFTISLILDPAGTLSPYLDNNDGQFILIDSDPENPPFLPPGEGDLSREQDEPTEGNDNLAFSIEPLFPLMALQDDAFKSTDFSKTKVAKDSSKGYLLKWQRQVMEFLFYRKSIGDDDNEFFKIVYELFIKKFEDQFTIPSAPTMDEIIKAVRNIASATIIKKFFAKALKEVKGIDLPEDDIINMNTTALCLLHYNLPSFVYHIKKEQKDTGVLSFTDTIQQFDGCSKTRIKRAYNKNNIDKVDYYNRPHTYSIPNALLTSDSFLLAKADVEAFYKRYQNYWDKYWLFQIPHHGSRHNADKDLLSRLSSSQVLFLNYGIKKEWGGIWRHPSPILINDLEATGHTGVIHSINETNGILFNFVLY
jgi:hypothetical protein